MNTFEHCDADTVRFCVFRDKQSSSDWEVPGPQSCVTPRRTPTNHRKPRGPGPPVIPALSGTPEPPKTSRPTGTPRTPNPVNPRTPRPSGLHDSHDPKDPQTPRNPSIATGYTRKHTALFCTTNMCSSAASVTLSYSVTYCMHCSWIAKYANRQQQTVRIFNTSYQNMRVKTTVHSKMTQIIATQVYRPITAIKRASSNNSKWTNKFNIAYK